jgi:glycosyltransferase involved in cell wall biosynthesis
MPPVPLLFVGDSVSAHSGLARILRDLAVRIDLYMKNTFRVATLGIGGAGSKKYPFFQYHIQANPNHQLPDLPQVVDDHFGDESGVIFFVGDASRYGWLCHPEVCTFDGLRNWLLTNRSRHKFWLYSPVDADSREGSYPKSLLETLSHFDRVLNYTAWSAGVTGYPDHLPHGLDSAIFHPHSRSESRQMFTRMGGKGITDDTLMLGIVAANQYRKDYGIGIETARVLLDQGHDVHLWIHTDDLRKNWDIPTMLQSFGLSGRNSLTLVGMPDETLSWMYSACSVTLGIGSEGWGFPLAESLACATPVCHGNYAGGTAIVPEHMRVDPVAFRYEGAHSWRRPVYDPKDWAAKVLEISGTEANLDSKLNWEALWPRWQSWLQAGVDEMLSNPADQIAGTFGDVK